VISRSDFTERANCALDRAADLASARAERPVGTLHLLAAFLVDGDSLAAEVLRGVGADLTSLQQLIQDASSSEPTGPASGGRFSLHLELAMRSAVTVSTPPGTHFAGTEHLLIGILDQPASDAAQLLSTIGVHRESISAMVKEVLGGGGGGGDVAALLDAIQRALKADTNE